MKTVHAILVAAAVTLGSAAFPSAGYATNIDYVLTKSGTANFGDLPPPGYGTVHVETVGSDLQFTITLTGGWFVDTGNGTQHNPVEFKLATSGLAFSGLASP